MTRAYVKMNGLGNDFVVVQTAGATFQPSPAQARAIADRTTGVGCDQLIAIEPSTRADARVRFWNADGGAAGACGNGARCAAWLLMQASGKPKAVLETDDRLLEASLTGGGLVTVDMGAPGLDWRDIPLEEAMDTRGIELEYGPRGAPLLHTPGAVSMGNPHAVFFVDDAGTAPVREAGSLLEHHMLFPEGANIGFAQVRARDRIRLRVWERGAGETLACGTGACAAAVAASRRGLTDRRVTIEMNGGELHVLWRESDDHVLLTGPVAVEGTGVLP
jgi:diaminopimelate epimerase